MEHKGAILRWVKSESIQLGIWEKEARDIRVSGNVGLTGKVDTNDERDREIN